MRDAGCVVAHSHPASRFPHPAVLNVALTGNIAAGKSTVVDLFRRWGATIIDADELARQAQAPGGAVLAAIAQRFGADVLAPDGSLDRAALRGKVMGIRRRSTPSTASCTRPCAAAATSWCAKPP